MKKLSKLLLILCVIIVFSTGCNGSEQTDNTSISATDSGSTNTVSSSTSPSPTLNTTTSNTSGKMVYIYLRAATHDWIFYTARDKYNSPANLYRCRPDFSDKQLIFKGKTQDAVSICRILDDWIYFTNYDDDQKLYRMKTDGSSVMKIFDGLFSSITFSEDWMYLSTASKVFKMKPDGSKQTTLMEYQQAYKLSGSLYPFDLIVDNGWIYFIDCFSYDCVYRMKLDGSSRNIINYDRCIDLKLYGGYLFSIRTFGSPPQSTKDAKIYRMNIDGTDPTPVIGDRCRRMEVKDDWIYYINLDDNDRMYKIKIDGTSRTKLIDVSVSGIQAVVDNLIYYSYDTGNGLGYCRIKTDGSDNIKIPFE